MDWKEAISFDGSGAGSGLGRGMLGCVVASQVDSNRSSYHVSTGLFLSVSLNTWYLEESAGAYAT